MNHTRKRMAIGLAVGALAPGVAQANIPHEAGQAPEATVAVAAGGHATPHIARLEASVPPAPRPIVIERSAGFDWTDAGIGFAAAAGLALLGAGSVVTVRWRRHIGSPAH
jgi:hypothetical protein